MTGHVHPDVGRLTFGCPGCIAAAEQARIDNAPIRAVTWRCSYMFDGTVRSLSFTLQVKVPDGWSGARVDEQYCDLSGEAFVMALPDDVPFERTSDAMETMEVERVTIGDLVHQPGSADAAIQQGSLL